MASDASSSTSRASSRSSSTGSGPERAATLPALTGPRLRSDGLKGIGDEDELAIQLSCYQRALTRTAPRFQLTGQLGRGSQGVVWSVTDRDCRRSVALKTLTGASCDADDIERFIHEAQVTAQLEHPGIVPVHDFGVLPDGTVFYAMKRIAGTPLADHLRGRAGDPSERFALCDIFLAVCDAVAFAHSRNVIHRDLKPRNIMVGEYGEVLVLDWGLAKVLGVDGESDTSLAPVTSLRSSGEGSDSHRTLVGHAVGTPAYMSPEQARGELSRVDRRSDVYSLGVLLYELLCGESPYIRGDVQRTLEQAAAGTWTALPQREVGRTLPRNLVAIVHRAMAHAPEDRYQGADELARDLRSFLAGQAVSARRETGLEWLGRQYGRHRRSCQVAALVAGIALAVGGGLWWQTRAQHDGAVAVLVDSAVQAEARGDLDAARSSNDRLLGLSPDHRDALRRRDRLDQAIVQRDRERAAAALAQRDRERAAALVAEAQRLSEQGDAAGLADARNRYEAAQRLLPGDATIAEALVALRLRQANVELAARRRADAADAARKREEAEVLAGQGRFAEALAILRQALALDALPETRARLEALAVARQRAEAEAEQRIAEEERRVAARERAERAGALLAAAHQAAAADQGLQARGLFDQARGLDPLHAGLAAAEPLVLAAVAREARSNDRSAAEALLARAAVLVAEAQRLDHAIAEAQVATAEARTQLHLRGDLTARSTLGVAERAYEDLIKARAAALSSAAVVLHQALDQAADHAPVRAAMAAFAVDRLREAEAAGQTAAAAAAEAQARLYDDGRHADLLAGTTWLTAPPDAPPLSLRALRVQFDRRLGPDGDVQSLAPGQTIALNHGRWLIDDGKGWTLALRLARGDRRVLRPRPVPTLPAQLVYLPGGAVFAQDGRAEATSVAPFALARHETTLGEWLEFLNDADVLARHAAARVRGELIYVPRSSIDASEPLLAQQAWTPWRRYVAPFLPALRSVDASGEGSAVALDPRTPVTGISASDVDAYLAWRSARDQRTWRLPSEAEWRFAVQGGDGRTHPWGDAVDLGLCQAAPNDGRVRAWPAPVGSVGTDRSVQGIEDLAGSLSELLAAAPNQPLRLLAGGNYLINEPARFTAWSRVALPANRVVLSAGFRLACDAP